MTPSPTRAAVVRLVTALVVGVVAVVIVALAVHLGSSTPLGAEDNGDGYRLYCGAGLEPRTIDHIPSWKGGVVLDFATKVGTCNNPVDSSALVILQLATLGRTGTFSLATLGWWYAVLVGVAAAVGAWAASAGGRRRALLALVPVLPLGLATFSRFFVSTFGEAGGLLGATTLGCGVAAVAATRPEHRGARVAALALVVVGGVTAGLAKVAFVPVLAVSVLVCAVVAVGSGRRRRLVGPAVAVVLAAGVALPWASTVAHQDEVYGSANAHDLVFTLAFRELGPAAAAPLGLPPEAAAFTGAGYFNGPPRPTAPWWRTAILDDPSTTRHRVYELLAAHPAVVARAVGVGLEATTRADLPYLPSTPADPAVLSPPSGDPGWSGARQPDFQIQLDASRRPPWIPTVLVVLGVLALMLAPVLRRRSPGAARWGAAAGLAALTALGIVVVAVLGDGYFEVFKHVWLASYFLALTVLALVGMVAAVARPRWAGRRRRRAGGFPDAERQRGAPAEIR